jgi:SET domain-containing protein
VRSSPLDHWRVPGIFCLNAAYFPGATGVERTASRIAEDGHFMLRARPRHAVGLLPPCEVRWISDDKGYGLFAKGFISQGTLLWKYSTESVREFTPQQFLRHLERLPSHQDKIGLLRTAYGWGGKMVLPLDDSKFWNHSRNRNCITGGGTSGGDTFALCEIAAGEELLDNYLDYEHPHWLTALYAKYGIDKSFTWAASSP